jgi:HK97 family phage prohead protease
MKDNKIEYRVLMNMDTMSEGNSDSRKISGYAVVFNTASEDLGFIETIAPEALDEAVLANSDVMALLDHDSNKVLARSNKGQGNLKLSIDEKGLYFEFDALEDMHGQSALEQVRAGIISQCSFAFTVAEGGDTWTYDAETDIYYRTIHKIDKLYDISLVYTPAYSDTHVEAAQRSLDAFKRSLSSDIEKTIQEVKEENISQQKALEQRTDPSIDYDQISEDLEAYWKELKEQIK